MDIDVSVDVYEVHEPRADASDASGLAAELRVQALKPKGRKGGGARQCQHAGCQSAAPEQARYGASWIGYPYRVASRIRAADRARALVLAC